MRYATERLSAIPGLTIKGTAQRKSGVLSWVMVDPPIATLDLGTQLDLRGIGIRTGHHCCQPLMDRFGVTSTARASLGVYNHRDDIDRLAETLAECVVDARRSSAALPGAGAGADALYPAAVAESPQAAADEIAEVFEFLPDWPMRHQHIIDLGDKLPAMPAALKTDANFVPGCQSVVHIAARVRPGTVDVIEFLADSDANIVRGLIALLQQLYSGQSARAILAFDAEAFFAHIGLDQNLSLTRRNGLASMVQRLRQLASRHSG